MSAQRRRDGANGWVKTPCPWSKTGWAWGQRYGEDDQGCTCEPCSPPKAAAKGEDA